MKHTDSHASSYQQWCRESKVGVTRWVGHCSRNLVSHASPVIGPCSALSDWSVCYCFPGRYASLQWCEVLKLHRMLFASLLLWLEYEREILRSDQWGFETCLLLFFSPQNECFYLFMYKVSTLLDETSPLAMLEPVLSGSHPASLYNELLESWVLLRPPLCLILVPSLAQKGHFPMMNFPHKDLNLCHGDSYLFHMAVLFQGTIFLPLALLWSKSYFLDTVALTENGDQWGVCVCGNCQLGITLHWSLKQFCSFPKTTRGHHPSSGRSLALCLSLYPSQFTLVAPLYPPKWGLGGHVDWVLRMTNSCCTEVRMPLHVQQAVSGFLLSLGH